MLAARQTTTPFKSWKGRGFQVLIRFPLNNFKFFELSFQSSLQLSLAVLVRYRSFVGIFSLGWSLPPVLGLHSQTTRLEERQQQRSTRNQHQN